MKKRLVIIVCLVFMMLVACGDSTTLDIKGESHDWDANIQYSFSEERMEYSGTLNYTGEGDLEMVSYRILSPTVLSMNANGHIDSIHTGDNEISIGKTGGTGSTHKTQTMRDAINDSTILVNWETSNGEFEEVIYLSSK